MRTTLRGRYRLERRIGSGGMAEVWEAALLGADEFARPVAVKLMAPALSPDTSSERAFGDALRKEARIASLLHHENIAAVLDFDRDEDGRYFLVMELVKGVSLRRLMRSGAVPFSVSALIVGKLLAGLGYAHAHAHDGRHLAIVHRDVSPHNVMLAWSGAVKLVDFGIARVVAATDPSARSVQGKLGYLSPEQAHGVELDGRSDVFSAGVVLHELLTGQRLFRAGDGPATLRQVIARKIPRPRAIRSDVPADLDAVCMNMLARDRTRRYPTAVAALDALLACESADARRRDDLALRRLLRERFPREAPCADSEPCPFLSDATVPLVPSGLFDEPDESDERVANPPDRAISLMSTPTHTNEYASERAFESAAAATRESREKSSYRSGMDDKVRLVARAVPRRLARVLAIGVILCASALVLLVFLV